MTTSKLPIIKVEKLSKSFEVAGGPVQVLKEVEFDVTIGEFAVIYGPSGCGKSTLLHTILGLEKPTSGRVLVFGHNLYNEYTEDTRADFRKQHIGMVYQQPNWVKALDVLENVALPLALLGKDKETRFPQALQMLKSLNMLEWKNYHPSELSSGQQQKVALARALITNPEIIIADEPTGNLDYESGKELISLLRSLSTEGNRTVVMVTHDLEYLKEADKAINLFDGQVKQIFSPKTNGAEVGKIKYKSKQDNHEN